MTGNDFLSLGLIIVICFVLYYCAQFLCEKLGIEAKFDIDKILGKGFLASITNKKLKVSSQNTIKGYNVRTQFKNK